MCGGTRRAGMVIRARLRIPVPCACSVRPDRPGMGRGARTVGAPSPAPRAAQGSRPVL